LILAACDKPKPKQDLAQADQATEESQPPPPQRFWGSIDGIDCEKIVGWAWDGGTPDVRAVVEFYDGATLVGTVTADVFRADLAKITDGKHSFTFPVPASLKDGKPRQIHGKIAGADFTFPPSPRPLTCPPVEIKK
jgi:hypothetical protein